MYNILSDEIKYCNINRIKDIIEFTSNTTNSVSVIFKKDICDIKKYQSLYKTFGIHIKPNILIMNHNCFNNLYYELSFDYEIDTLSSIFIYNGLHWNNYSIDNKIDKFTLKSRFNFKNLWRIRFDLVTNFKINNIKLEIHNSNYEFINQKKILFIGGSEKWMNNNLNKSLINTYGDSIFYNLSYYFKFKYNYLIFNINLAQKESKYTIFNGLIHFNDCIDLSQRGLYNKEPDFVNQLKTFVSNNLACICDNNINVPNNENINYLLYTLPNIEYNNTKYIAPGCDSTIFKVDKNNSKFIILIDDCYYDPKMGNDNTPNILNKCISFLKEDDNLEIIRFGYKDKQSNFIDPYENKIKNYIVIKNNLSIIEKAKLHNKANIWWGTHSESFGMEYLESAMAGCLLVYKKGYINTFFNQFYTKQYLDINDITLNNLKEYKHYDKQHKIALKYNWETTVDNILNIFYKK